jgi:hypothetical protein
MFGGNSNWRGPVWMPVNALIIRALLQYYSYFGDAFKIECPTGSGNVMTLFEVAEEIARRLSAIFLRGEHGRRPVYGGTEKFQTDPHWRDYLQFFEYFHADNGAGLGANHQTGWTGVVARVMDFFATTSAEDVRRFDKRSVVMKRRRPKIEASGRTAPREAAGTFDANIGAIHVLLERLNRQRLPRATKLRDKVERGECLSTYDTEYIEKAIEEGEHATRLTARYPQYQQVVNAMTTLYADILRKGHANASRERR